MSLSSKSGGVLSLAAEQRPQESAQMFLALDPGGPARRLLRGP